jgi:hypothetical protein
LILDLTHAQRDTVTAIFELGGALANCMNIRAIWRAREVKGVHWATTAFYFLWGAWNLVFYPGGGFVWSFIGGIAIMTTNVVWLALVYYFWQQRRKAIHA